MTKIRPNDGNWKLEFVKFSSAFRRYFSSASRNLPRKCACCSADCCAYCVLRDCVEPCI